MLVTLNSRRKQHTGTHELLLVALPWAKADHMSVQIGGLKSYMTKVGVPTRTRHYYRDIVDYLPGEVVDKLFESNAGEYLSLAKLWPASRAAVERAVTEVCGELISFSELEARFDAFLAEVLAELSALAVPHKTLVGFTTSLQQIATSLLVAQMLKAAQPAVQTIFGGAILLRESATELVRAFPQIDFAIFGEGEEPLRILFESGALSDRSARKDVPNLVWRHELGDVETNHHTEMANLSALPVPDYSDYFEHALRPGPMSLYPKISVETSRGCFFDKCTFCNLNSQWQKRYRAKSDQQVYEEIQTQVRRYKTPRILFVDTNISNRGTLFKLMAADHRQYHGWAEVSGHLKRITFVNMRRAGIADIQIGIESFSPALLGGFEKGVTVMRNMEMLKWCAELEYSLFYNIIIHYPSETQEDADQTLAAFRFAKHFQPPNVSTFMLTVDSPIEKALRERGGKEELKPQLSGLLAAMIPEPERAVLGPLLSPFIGLRPASEKVDWRGVERGIEDWKKIWERNHHHASLTLRIGEGFVIITDRSEARAKYHRLEGMEAAIYLACMKESRSLDQIVEETGIHPLDVEMSLMTMEALGLLFSSEGRHLALAVWEDRLASAELRDGDALSAYEASAMEQAASYKTVDARELG